MRILIYIFDLNSEADPNPDFLFDADANLDPAFLCGSGSKSFFFKVIYCPVKQCFESASLLTYKLVNKYPYAAPDPVCHPNADADQYQSSQNDADPIHNIAKYDVN